MKPAGSVTFIIAVGIIAIGNLIGCASGPPSRSYVLSPPAEPVAGGSMRDGRAVVELRTVELPDYLDSSDIYVRDGRNELKSSQTGRWGERLSVGITHALAAVLAQRRPDLLVTHASLPGQSGRQLLVDVEAFDIWPDGRCVLTARWTVLGNDRRTIASSGRGTFVTTTAGGLTDAAIVSAMAAAVTQLADRVALALGRDAR
jgi:uncharacterized protein